MTLAEEAARKRKVLEQAGKLPHDPSFDEVVKKQQKNTLLIVALLSALAYGFALDAYYLAKYPVEAHSGEILAKSDLTKQEIKALTIVAERGVK